MSNKMTSSSTPLKILIDSPDETCWQQLLPLGIFYGITTNPKLLAQANIPNTLTNLKKLAVTAFNHGAKEVHLQVWGSEAAAMITIGQQLAAIDERVMVKVPATPAGFLTAQRLIQDGIPITLTALHRASQALIAITLGVRYAVPYLGRMCAVKLDALNEVIAMQEIISRHPGPTQVLLASIRDLEQVVAAARQGISVFTLPPILAQELINHPLSQAAAEEFENSVQVSLIS